MIHIMRNKTLTKANERVLKEGKDDWIITCKQEILRLLKEDSFEITKFITKLICFLNAGYDNNVVKDDMDIDSTLNTKLKVILTNWKEIDSETLWYNNVRLISKLLGIALYGYQETGSYRSTVTKYRGVCGAGPEFGHENCADCIREWWGAEEVVMEDDIPTYDRVQITPQQEKKYTS